MPSAHLPRRAAAAILYGDRLFLRQSLAGNWCLPEVAALPGESDEDALRRGLPEATGLSVTVHAPVGGDVDDSEGVVRLWLCTVAGGAPLAPSRWLATADAEAVPLAHGQERLVWDALSLLGEPVLVRRARWPATGVIETAPDGLYFQLPKATCLRWERLPLPPVRR
ncbi:MAG: hypothetical protein KBC95_01330 [Candidatus Peribacteraceae bacterium]|nr:hypothetical protein [Candidatus Peribacteraceae bacterium]